MMKRIAAKVRANLAMFWSVLKNEGALPCMECVVRRVGATTLGMSSAGHPRMNLMLFRMTDLLYDWIHKVDTGGVIDLPEMEGHGKNYVATPPRAWKLMIKHLPARVEGFSYVDFGCGKGRTLLLAAERGFQDIVGVDISAQLLEVARENMARKGIPGKLVCCDVREFEFPERPLVLFMYNPFYPDVMQAVAERLRKSTAKTPRDVFILYYSAAIKDVWAEQGFEIFRSSHACYPNYTIYRSAGAEAVPGVDQCQQTDSEQPAAMAASR